MKLGQEAFSEQGGGARQKRSTDMKLISAPIGYFGDVIFQASSKKICTFYDMSRSISSRYSEHGRYKKKPQREFEGPQNQTVSFKMKFVAGHGVSPRKMAEKIIKICEKGTVCPFVIGGRKVGGGRWTVDSVGEDYLEVWSKGELISVEVTVQATDYY